MAKRSKKKKVAGSGVFKNVTTTSVCIQGPPSWLRAKDLDGRTVGGWNYAITLLFAALAMASKSSTVILPIVLCLCAWWMEGRWHWRNVARVVPIFLMSIAASALSIWTQGLAMARVVTDPQWVRTWPERLATAGDAVWFISASCYGRIH